MSYDPTITFRLEPDSHRWLKEVTKKTGKRRSEVIREALKLYRESEQNYHLT